jgi:hypothetical protein
MGMETTTTHIAAPIFIIGSPRSGTSILTWCLGQHPNILPTEESDWLGPFASQVGAHHALGSKRGERSQLGALGVERAEFFSEFGEAIDGIILGHRKRLEELNRAAAQRDPLQISEEFAISRSATEPKSRWVDGTPEYSMHICGLHKLFPRAKFLHIVRDADAVAASMIAFRHPDGSSLVASADEAYAYWQRTTRACLLAGDALGADFVYRLRHADLAAQPEAALRNVFDFLGEPFAPETTAPHQQFVRRRSGVAGGAAGGIRCDRRGASIERPGTRDGRDGRAGRRCAGAIRNRIRQARRSLSNAQRTAQGCASAYRRAARSGRAANRAHRRTAADA